MHTDVHESTEVSDVRHHTFHPATRHEVVDGLDAVIELSITEFLTRVTARLLKFLEDIFQSSTTDFVGEEFVELDALHSVCIADHFLDRNADLFSHLFDEGIVFRMHGGIVERIFSTRDTHKACGLFKSLRAKALDLLQIFTACISAVFFAVLHNRFRERVAETCHVREERSRSAVHVNTDHVHAAFHDFVQALLEFALVHVVLVLTHANGLWIDLDKFSERILQAAANRNSATGRHVFLREFGDSDHACTIDRCTSFGDDNARRNLALELESHLATESVRFAACRTVTDCDEVNLILVDEAHQINCGSGLVVPRFMRLDDAVIHELAVLVEHSDLATRTETRVEGEHSLVACRSGEQNVLEVLGEHLESFFFGGVLEEEAHFAFHARLEQAFPSVLAHIFEIRLPDRVVLDDLILEVTDHFFVRDFDGEAEHLFLFATAESEHTVARDL